MLGYHTVTSYDHADIGGRLTIWSLVMMLLNVWCGDHQHHDNLHGGDDQFNVKVVGHSEQHKERVYLKI